MGFSTFCRGCGEHINLEVLNRVEEAQPSSFSRMSSRARNTVRTFLTGGLRPLVEASSSDDNSSPRDSPEKSTPRSIPSRPVECFECAKSFTAPSVAESTQCPACGAYADLRDVDISHHSNQRISTRGDVIIRPGGNLTTIGIRCNDLNVMGTLSAASVVCTGTVLISSKVHFEGKLQCETLVIEKGARVTFTKPIEATTIFVRGSVDGDLRVSGHVDLRPSGRIMGDVQSGTFSMEQGATFDGLAYTTEETALP